MAESARRSGAVPDPRLRALTSAYRGIERRYDELERLSRREHALLSAGAALGEVRAVLEEKRTLIETIRTEEGRVAEAKSWWSRVRGDLPAHETRELLDLLDAVSRRIERALALESDCRALLSGTAGFRVAAPPSPAAARLSAAAAYGRGPAGGAR